VKVDWQRRNPIFFERGGQFNPSFVFIGALLCALIFAVVWSVFHADRTVAALAVSGLIVTVNILAMTASSETKAKVIAGATSSGDIAKGLAHLGGSTEEHDPGTPLK